MRRGRPVSGQAQGNRTSRFRQDIGRRLDDVVLLLVIVVLIPLAIVVIGTPVALCVRLLIEIAQRY
jgi:hypothetical protein